MHHEGTKMCFLNGATCGNTTLHWGQGGSETVEFQNPEGDFFLIRSGVLSPQTPIFYLGIEQCLIHVQKNFGSHNVHI